tara:strand:+ start:78 stop:530 length:453 start_codon:yes stop_codon:yes gene_type:complete
MKIFKFLILLIFLSNCGYSIVHKDIQKKNINIKIIDTKGDTDINSKLVKKLKKLTDKNARNSIDININSNYQKKIISRTSTGSVEDYKVILTVEYNILINENIQKINFQQEFKLKNTDESFERQKNEAILIDDFASSSINELFLQISNLK